MQTNSKTLFKIFHLSALCFTLSGLLYGVLKYVFKVETEYGVRPHHLQGLSLYAHILFAGFGVFCFGALFTHHILPKLSSSSKSRKKSGVSLALLSAIMIISGYLIQIQTDLTWQKYMDTLHWGASISFILLFLIHLKFVKN